MNTKKYNRTNFHRHTFCVFQETDLIALENKLPDYKSKSDSCYYFTEDGVYRLSNHWGRAANCKWRLQRKDGFDTNRTKLGFAKWTSFCGDNDTEKLYFITVDYDTKFVQYQHKDSEEFQEELIVRTASATTKVIKTIRDLLTQEAWTKHFDMDISELRQKIIHQLITTDQTLPEIKREIQNTL